MTVELFQKQLHRPRAHSSVASFIERYALLHVLGVAILLCCLAKFGVEWRQSSRSTLIDLFFSECVRAQLRFPHVDLLICISLSMSLKAGTKQKLSVILFSGRLKSLNVISCRVLLTRQALEKFSSYA